MHKLRILLFFIVGAIFLTNCAEETEKSTSNTNHYFKSSKPYTRWWWFASLIQKEDIKHQLDWAKEQNFGGVEVAWIYPYSRKKSDTVNNTPRFILADVL